MPIFAKCLKFLWHQFGFLFGLPPLLWLCYNLSNISILIWGVFIYNPIEQVLHKLLHHPITGAFHRSHMNHHREDPKQLDAQISTLDYFLIIYGAFGFACYPMLSFFLSLHTTDNSLFIYILHLCMSIISFWLHDHYHQGSGTSVFEKYAWFQRRRSYHYTHHYYHNLNLSIAAIFFPLSLLRLNKSKT